MSTHYQPILDLRGSFQDSQQFLQSSLPSYPIEEILSFFFITDEHILSISRTSVELLFFPSQEIVWNIMTPTPIQAASLAPDQPLLAVVLTEETLVWDLQSGQVIQRLTGSFEEKDGGEIAFGRNGIIALAPFHEGVQFWNAQTGQWLCTIVDEDEWYLNAPKSLAFSPDGTLLAVGHAEAADVSLWRVPDGYLYQKLETHPLSQRIRGLAFTPDGSLLIGSEWSTDPDEESMSIWEVSTGKRIGAFPRMAWLPAVSSNGQFVASVNEDALMLWRLANRSILWQVDSPHESKALLFSPSGQLLLSYYSRGAICWDVLTGQQVSVLSNPNVYFET